MKEIRSLSEITIQSYQYHANGSNTPFRDTVWPQSLLRKPAVFSHSGPGSLPWTANTKAPPTLVSVEAGSLTWRLSRQDLDYLLAQMLCFDIWDLHLQERSTAAAIDRPPPDKCPTGVTQVVQLPYLNSR